MDKFKVLYFFVGESSFVKKDLEIISTEFIVKRFNFRHEKKWKTPLELIKEFFFILKNIAGCKLVICQLSGYHSFFPILISKIFGIPSLIIAAGTDCQAFPSIGYGNFQKNLLKVFTKLSFQLCTHISPKHQSLWLCDYTYDKSDYPMQGIKYFIPGINKPCTVIENGYDGNVFKRTLPKKKNHFLTVSGNLEAPYQKQLKGIDLILAVAEHFPDSIFTIVGVTDNGSFGGVPKNVLLLPPIKNHELINLFSESEFYLQLSMAEGFPNALCEAMLCECIPIGSKVFSIPEIIAESGYILPVRDKSSLKTLIQKVLTVHNEALGITARERVLNHYTIERRKTLLIKLCSELVNRNIH